jgi:hypothetical protein
MKTLATRYHLQDDLGFGLSIPGGGVVTDARWERFKKYVIAKLFPNGCTVLKGEGFWMGGEENSIIVRIIHEQTALDMAKIKRICLMYKRLFRQQAVLCSRAKVEMILF